MTALVALFLTLHITLGPQPEHRVTAAYCAPPEEPPPTPEREWDRVARETAPNNCSYVWGDLHGLLVFSR